MNFFENLKKIQVNNFIYYENLKTYYDGKSIFEVIEKKDQSEQFLNRYFHCGGKEKVFDPLIKDLLSSKDNKYQHIVSTYFIGCLFLNIISRYIKNIIDIGTEKQKFLYVWFLTTLYHDTVSALEYSDTDHAIIDFLTQIKSKKTIDERINLVKTKYGMKYNLFDHNFNKNTNINLSKCSMYSIDLIKKYFQYRTDKNRLDHGIISGMLLYDRLMQNYAELKNKFANINSKEFKYNGLIFKEIDKDIYAYCAYSIVQHNIFHANNKSYEIIYKQYALDFLIGNKSKFNRKKYPLTFLLGLIDTIEPIKELNKNKLGILDKHDLNIGFNNFFKKISISSNNVNLFKNISALADWLEVKVEKNNNEITINIE